MRDRLSEWQLQQAESTAIPGVEDFLEQLAATESSAKRDQDASYFASREDQPQCGYDLAETADRRRQIMREYQLSYDKIKRGMQFSISKNVSFELAKNFMASRSLIWFLDIAPVLVLNNSISVDIYYQISAAVVGVHTSRNELDKLTAAVIRKVGLFKGNPSENDAELVVQYRSRAANFNVGAGML